MKLRVDPTRIRAMVDSAILPILSEYDVPGLAVGVTIHGQSLFFNYGVASRAGGLPVTEETLFELGSVSKLFTATLAAHAQVLGRLSLDEHPGTYVPQLRGSAIDRARLVHLGTYTAGGLPLQFPDSVADDAAMMRFFAEWQPAALPGAQRRYSNPSIGLLGRIAAAALGGSFADVVESHLLPQLGLRRTHVRVPDHGMTRYAWGYNAAGEAVRVNPGLLDAEAYGIKSSAADMLRFVQLNMEPGALGESLRGAIEHTHTGYFQVGDMVQGLGWEQYPWPVTVERLLAGNSRTLIMEPNPALPLPQPWTRGRSSLFNKTGSTNGFGAYVAFVPEQKIGVVLLANRNYPIPARIGAAHMILERLAQ